jgi:hypothetical protein
MNLLRPYRIPLREGSEVVDKLEVSTNTGVGSWDSNLADWVNKYLTK